jgi:phosphonate transport system permease protein
MAPLPVRTTEGPNLPELTLREASRGASSRSSRSLTRRTVVVATVAATVAALVAARVGRSDLIRTGGAGQLGEFFRAAVHPRLDGQFIALTGSATVTTLAYAVLGTALSLTIGLIGGVLTSQTWWRSGPRGRPHRSAVAGWTVARAVLALPRGIHEVLWGLFLLSIFGIQPIVAVLAIGIPFGAVTAKVFSEILDETSHRPYAALIAAGASRPAALAYGLLPPALFDLFSYSFYRFECAIRSAAILGLVGAGGLGFQLQLSFQALQYDEIWTLLYALILLCAAADFWSSAMRHRRVGRLATNAGRPRRDRVRLGSMVVAALLVPFSAWWIGLDLSVLWAGRTWTLTRQFLRDAWPPTVAPSGVTGLLRQTGETLGMSVVAIVFAFVGGMLLAFPAANLSRLGHRSESSHAGRATRLLVVAATRAVLIVFRAIPPPVWALLLLFVLYPGMLPGALALGVYTVGVLGRLMAEAAENLDSRPLRALRANGAPVPHIFCYGVVPAAAPKFVAFGLYRWEVTIRETVVVGVVGAGGLGLLMDHQLAAFDYSGALATLVTLVALTLIVDLVSAMVRRSLR